MESRVTTPMGVPQAGDLPLPIVNRIPLSREIELRRIIGLAQASELSGLSIDTLKRRYPAKIITLSPRRRGMRLGDALELGEPDKPPKQKPPLTERLSHSRGGQVCRGGS